MICRADHCESKDVMMSNRPALFLPSVALSAGLLFVLLVSLLFTTHLQADEQRPQVDGEQTEDWLSVSALTQGVADPSVATLGALIHVVGGVSAEGPMDLHQAFDPRQHRWATLPALPVPRSDAVSAVISDTLYVIGGYNHWYGGVVSYTHGYNVVTQRWVTATAMLTAVSGAASAFVNGELYVFGGFDNHAETAIVQSYDPRQDHWRVPTTMPVARSEFGAAVLNERIYLIGGNIFSTTVGNHVEDNAEPLAATLVSVYHPQTEQWSTAAPLPAPRVDFTIIVRDGKIYVIGGTDRWLAGLLQKDLFIYDPQQDEWHLGPALPEARGGLRSTIWGDDLYIIGGYNTDSRPLTSVDLLETIAPRIYLPVITNQ
jgi:hypothetical protein